MHSLLWKTVSVLKLQFGPTLNCAFRQTGLGERSDDDEDGRRDGLMLSLGPKRVGNDGTAR